MSLWKRAKQVRFPVDTSLLLALSHNELRLSVFCSLLFHAKKQKSMWLTLNHLTEPGQRFSQMELSKNQRDKIGIRLLGSDSYICAMYVKEHYMFWL